jgi:hypothetical protein
MSTCLTDPFDRDEGPHHRTSLWVVLALVGLIVTAMAVDVARAASVSLMRVARGGGPRQVELRADAVL